MLSTGHPISPAAHKPLIGSLGHFVLFAWALGMALLPAQERGIPVWCGGMLESGIGRSHNIALSTLENFTLPGDVSASKRYWQEDIIEPEVEVTAKGTIPINDAPGSGYQVREDRIRGLTVKEETFRPNGKAAG